MKFFILQAGRSGSLFISKVLKKNKFKNVKHEFKLMEYKPDLVRFRITKKEKDKVKFIKNFQKVYLSKTNRKEFIDISYGITNEDCIREIKKKYPNAKFIFVYRNGYDVVNSWFNKLGNEIYHPSCMKELNNYFLGKQKKPPNKKEFWWPIKIDKKKKFTSSTQFSYVCEHWNEVVKLSFKLKKKYKNDVLVIKFEDLIKKENIKKIFFKFLGRYNYEFHNKKINIVNKVKYKLNNSQLFIFNKKCSFFMKKLGYKVPNYDL